VALRGGKRGRGQVFDDGGARHDQPPPAGLRHQRRGDRHSARGGERHGQQPGRQLAPAGGREVREAEGLAQLVEMGGSGLRSRAVGVDRLRRSTDLVCHEAQRRLRDCLNWPQRPAGVSERTELKREAKPVVVAPSASDRGEVGVAQRPVPDEGDLLGRQDKQVLELRTGERAPSRHGGLSS
jgi:hypothetical protein